MTIFQLLKSIQTKIQNLLIKVSKLSVLSKDVETIEDQSITFVPDEGDYAIEFCNVNLTIPKESKHEIIQADSQTVFYSIDPEPGMLIEHIDLEVAPKPGNPDPILITENGEYNVSNYDLAEVDVQPLPKQDKVVEITKNGVTEVIADDAHILGKVTINTDTTKQVMTDYINNGGTFAFYTGNEIPLVDWDRVTTAINLWRGLDLMGNEAFSKEILKLQYPNSTNNSYMFYSTRMVSSEPITLNLYGALGRYAFSNCIWDIKELTIDAKNVTDLTNFFAYGNNSDNPTILLNSDSVEQFTGAMGLHTLNAIRCDSMLNFCTIISNAIELGGFINLGKSLVVNISISFVNSPNLTHKSILNIFNTIYDMNLRNIKVSVIIKLGAQNFAKVTEDEIKIATDKGWTVTQ